MALFTRHVSFVFKEQPLRIPFFGGVLRGLDLVRLNRGSARQARQAVKQESAERLAKGDVAVLVPEGTRVPHDAPFEDDIGGHQTACAIGMPAVPAVLNAGKVWPATGWPTCGAKFVSSAFFPQELSYAVREGIKAELPRL